MEKYMVIVVQGYEAQQPNGSLLDVTTIELMENDADKALKRAKKLIKKKFYRISSIIENYVVTKHSHTV